MDATRIYAVGDSLGSGGPGTGVRADPGRFAAISPACGVAADSTRTATLKEVPVWAFHGTTDDIIPIRYSRTMIDSLQLAGEHARLTVYTEYGHNIGGLTHGTPQSCSYGSCRRKDRAMRRDARRGFTLIELLVVIAIIGLLVQMMLPAVQAAREAARRRTCSNHLHQIGLAAQMHLNATGHFPTGGWQWNWVGDPDRGTGGKQPGGWIYNLLPFLELQDIHDLGAGGDLAAKKRAAATMQATPATVFNCPSRRDAIPFRNARPHEIINSDATRSHARSDYAANGGDLFLPTGHGPTSYDEVDSGSYEWRDMGRMTGICFLQSVIRPRHVTDGLSHTYFAGEKYLNPDNYETGDDFGDDFSMYQGADFDVLRWTSKTATVEYFGINEVPNLPSPDRRGHRSGLSFGR